MSTTRTSGARLEYGDDVIRVYTPFTTGFVRAIKGLPVGTRMWNKVGRYWAVDISQEHQLLEIMYKLFPDFQVGDKPEESLGIPGHIKGKKWELELLKGTDAT